MSLGPSVLFVPASGGPGSGELTRCLLLARLVAVRNPSADLRFIVSRRARNGNDTGFPTTLVDRSPTYHTPEVIAAIESQNPNVVLFDNAGRAEQFRAARQCGARVVIIISRPTTLRKAFGLRRLWNTDQQWLLQPDWALPRLSSIRRLKARLHPGLEILRFPTTFESSTETECRQLRCELGLGSRPYILFCPGGGGQKISGTPVAEIFHAGAVRLARELDQRVVVVLGPNAPTVATREPGVVVLQSLEHARLMALVHEASIVVTGGGDLLVQAIAMSKPTISTPVASDQGDRIRKCTALGLTVAAPCDAEALAQAANQLLNDAAGTEALRMRLAASSIVNGLSGAVTVIEGLAATATHAEQAFAT